MSCLRARLLHWVLWNALRQLQWLPATLRRNGFSMTLEKISSFLKIAQLFAWHFKNTFGSLRLVLIEAALQFLERIVFSFHLMNTCRINLVFSVLTFIVFVLCFTDHIFKRIYQASTRRDIYCTLGDFIYSKNWYLLSTAFFSLKKKLAVVRKADELVEVISKGRKNVIRAEVLSPVIETGLSNILKILSIKSMEDSKTPSSALHNALSED